jgi:putative membrane-bound dehydrogenase-like protein
MNALMKLKLFLCIVASTLVASLSAADAPAGIKPTGADGRALNLDFEDGTLKDWRATGDAFDRQPIKGDTVSARLANTRSRHAGEYWIGTYERSGDEATGTLTSVSFKVTQRWASFLVGGGGSDKTRAEVVLKDGANEKVIFQASGEDKETMVRAAVDLQAHQGKEIFVRLVDLGRSGWGHINFDDFLFHASKPAFANAIAQLPPADEVKFSGLSALEAANTIALPKGFKATLFAGEPDVKQPIAFCIDDRGRLWVAEGYTYPKRKGSPPKADVTGAASANPTKDQLSDIFGSNDRILVFEDSDGDGKFDKRTVFLEKLNLVSGLEVGFGGVWIGAAPYLMFVPVKDWDNPQPAGDPKILLDGWDYARDTHETLNTFQWGPDGWLYGCHGVFCPSHVGKPGTPKEQRQWVDAGVWRYHPTKQLFEVFAEGTSNPWGLDFDEHGQAFIEACVIPHLFHMIQGARYHRQGGAHYAVGPDETLRFASRKEGRTDKTLHPYVYEDIKTIADHVHFRGNQWNDRDRSTSWQLGGGHAHAGLLIYGGDSFPAEYRGKLFMNNIHGQRINMDIPQRKGSGFVGKHGADFMNFNDKWSQVIDLRTGADGSVFMIDWYDKNQCHLNTIESHDRSNGRIFKISYGNKKTRAVDLQKLDDDELVKLLANRNSWHARHAQRILQERYADIVSRNSAAGTDLEKVQRTLDSSSKSSSELGRAGKLRAELESTKRGRTTEERLRRLWTLHSTLGLSESVRAKGLADSDDLVRAWTIQLACENKKPSEALLKEFARMAREDKSPVVRLYLASALQRLPIEQRSEILEALLAHAEDASDHNLPLMYWYAAEPLAGKDVATAAKLLPKTKIPQVREYITRRMTAGMAKATSN